MHARWEYAVERGTPALVTHAMPDTSYPILRRLGFEEVCTIRGSRTSCERCASGVSDAGSCQAQFGVAIAQSPHRS